MNERRRILEFEVSPDNLNEFLENSRNMMISEVITAAEEMLYNKTKTAQICQITINDGGFKTIMDCKLRLEDVVKDLKLLLNWSIEHEEYELSHRIKLINEYIDEYGISLDTVSQYTDIK
jgi:hypothetical protein